MVVIPAGKFIMGSKNGRKRELPLHRVRIPKPLAIGRFEVTFNEFDACVAAGGCNKKPFDRGWGRGKRPVMNVLIGDIAEYAAWLSKKSGARYRLPSEAEWEYAARAGTSSGYWWGDQMRAGAANCRKCGSEWSGQKTAPVGRFEPNPWGIYDMHGNVLEITSDCWNTSHFNATGDGTKRIDGDCKSRVVKSGAWYYLPKVSRSASRVRNDVRIISYFIGFRLVREMN
jgi:formylglycine-generating enzyme required for sulfatase activity